MKNKFKSTLLALFLGKECPEGGDHQELIKGVYLALFACIWFLGKDKPGIPVPRNVVFCVFYGVSYSNGCVILSPRRGRESPRRPHTSEGLFNLSEQAQEGFQ